MSSSAEFFLEVREKNRNGETWSGCRKDHLWGVAPLREIDKETRAPQAESALFFPWLILLPGSSLSSVRWGRTQLFLVFKGSRSFLWFFAFKWAVVGLLIFFFFPSLQRGALTSHLASCGCQKSGSRTVEQSIHRTLVLQSGSPRPCEVDELCKRGLLHHTIWFHLYKVQKLTKLICGEKGQGSGYTWGLWTGKDVREPSSWCGGNTLCGNLGARVYVCKRMQTCKNVSSSLPYVL